MIKSITGKELCVDEKTFTKIPIDMSDLNLVCPISCDYPEEPSLLGTNLNQVYDKKSLEKWLNIKNIDPCTGLSLSPSCCTYTMPVLTTIMTLTTQIDDKYYFFIPHVHDFNDFCTAFYEIFIRFEHTDIIDYPPQLNLIEGLRIYSKIQYIDSPPEHIITNKIIGMINDQLSEYFIVSPKIMKSIVQKQLGDFIPHESHLDKLFKKLKQCKPEHLHQFLLDNDMDHCIAYSKSHYENDIVPTDGFQIIVSHVNYTNCTLMTKENNHFKQSIFLNCVFKQCKFENFAFCHDSHFIGCTFDKSDISQFKFNCSPNHAMYSIMKNSKFLF